MKILCYFDDEKGRDVEILLPLIYFTEKILNQKVEKAFIFDIDKIRRYQPDLVIIANTIGSKLHHQVTKYAHDNQIKVFALISEGNFKTNGTFNYWGYNTDKEYYQEYICHWSKRTQEFLSKELPQYKDRMVLTGATGFDRYKIYHFQNRAEFLKKYQLKNYKKVIGYAGWGFGKIYNSTGLMEVRNANKGHEEERIAWMKKEEQFMKDVLKKAVENNPDTLFILKRHPNEIHPHLTQADKNEMVDLQSYPNVLYLRNEEDVHSLISVSDIWCAFESTTVIESWVMKEQPTIFINSDPNFKRDENYKGTVIVRSYDAFQEKIDEYYRTGRVQEMYEQDKIDARQKIIENVIGFADGLNHVRAGYYLQKTIQTIEPNVHQTIQFKAIFFIRFIRCIWEVGFI